MGSDSARSLVSVTSTNTEGLDDADYCYRLSNFSRAFAISRGVVGSDAYRKWNAKRQHEAVKAFICYGHHANRQMDVMHWLKQQQLTCGEYPLYLCEWAQLSLSTSSARHLRLAAHSTLNAAESLLREALAEASAAPKQQQATLNMCASVLIEDVLLRQNNNWQGADAVLREYKAELSPETAKALEQKIRRSTGARARAAHKPQVVARPLPGIVPREVKPAPETSSFWIQLYNWCLRVVSHPDALKMFACTFLGLMAWKYWTNPSKSGIRVPEPVVPSDLDLD